MCNKHSSLIVKNKNKWRKKFGLAILYDYDVLNLIFRYFSAGKGSPTNAQSESVKCEHKLVDVACLGRQEEHQFRSREVR